MQHKEISKVVRAELGITGTPYPIHFVDGFAPPKLSGRSYHWTTPGGRPVRFPNAYARAWGKPVYHASTLAITVGAGWVIQTLLAS